MDPIFQDFTTGVVGSNCGSLIQLFAKGYTVFETVSLFSFVLHSLGFVFRLEEMKRFYYYSFTLFGIIGTIIWVITMRLTVEGLCTTLDNEFKVWIDKCKEKTTGCTSDVSELLAILDCPSLTSCNSSVNTFIHARCNEVHHTLLVLGSISLVFLPLTVYRVYHIYTH